MHALCTDSDFAFLLPGQLFFTRKHKKIQTVLGSCVTITMYCGVPKFAVICHAVHPYSNGEKDVKFVDAAIERMIAEIKKMQIPMSQVTVKLFGGGYTDTGSGQPYEKTIGYKNVVEAKKILDKFGIKIDKECTGGACGRKLIFCTIDGKVYVRKIGGGANGIKQKN